MEQLLKILEKNARIPLEDAAAMIGKTTQEAAAMLDQAQSEGIVRGFRTLVDWEKANVACVEAVI